MNPEIVAPFLLEFLAKSAFVLAAAALIDRTWLRASAAQRHLVWCAAFATVLLLPITRWHAPRWPVPLQRVTLELPPQARTDLPPIESGTVPGTLASAVPAPSRWRWPDWKQSIVISWSAGVGLLLAARLLGSLRLVWLRRMTHPLTDARTQRTAAEIFTALGIRRAVDLRVSSMGGVPLTWGTLHPVLMLPANALAWSDVRLAAALRHEAGHIARGDHFTRSIAQLACALYWPNPLVWLGARSLRTAQEQATDDLVLRGGTAPEEYAEQLFEVARSLAAQHRFIRHAVAMASPSTLERRMLAIVDDRRNRRPLSLHAVLGGMLAVTLALGISTAAQLKEEEQKADAEAPSGKVPKGPQIEIEAKFVEISETTKTTSKDPVVDLIFGNAAAPKTATGAFSVAGVLTEPQLAAVMKELNVLKGVDLLSTPRVTTNSGQKATIEINQEFRYPAEYEKDGKGWKPKEFTTRNVGVTFGLLATAKADGSLELQLEPSVVEFLGFMDQETGTMYPAKSKPDAAVTDIGSTELVPAGHRAKPIFSERKITTSVTIWSGGTVVLSPIGETAESKGFQREGPARNLTVFVTAKMEEQAPSAAAPKPQPLQITAENTSYDAKTGEAKANGNVEIKTSYVTIRTEEATIIPNTMPPAAASSARKGPFADEPAAKFIIPKLELRDAKLSEAIHLLMAKAQEAGVAGTNIVITESPAPEPLIMLSLTNIPWTEALKYVAQLSGFTIRRNADAYLLEPTPKK